MARACAVTSVCPLAVRTDSGLPATTTENCGSAPVPTLPTNSSLPAYPAGPAPANGTNTPSSNRQPSTWWLANSITLRPCKKRAAEGTTSPWVGNCPTGCRSAPYPACAFCLLGRLRQRHPSPPTPLPVQHPWRSVLMPRRQRILTEASSATAGTSATAIPAMAPTLHMFT